MAKITTEAKVGVFVLAALAVLGYMSFKIGGFQIKSDPGWSVSAVFDTASGLKRNVPVEIAGINVGRVEDIALAGRRAKVTLRLNSDVSLPNDSVAVIRTKGVLGDKYVELLPGSPDAPAIAPDGVIAQTQTPMEIDQIVDKIGTIGDDIQRVAKSLGDVLGSPEGRGDLRRMLSNFSQASENLARITSENQVALNQIIENLKDFSGDIRDVSSANKDNINAIILSFRATSEKMAETIVTLQAIAERVNRGEGSLGQLVNDDTTIESLNATLASLEDISKKISQGEGTIGKLVNDSSTVDKIDEALTGINDYLAKDKEYKFYVDYRGEWLTEHDELKSTLSVRIQPKKDKYYLLGITADSWGTLEKTETTETINGRRVTTVEEKRTRGDLKFNAQIAKRYRDLVVRGGLIESGGGVGLDYYLLDDDLKFTFEAFSGDVDKNPHLRTGLYWDFYKPFYLSVGYDDFMSDDDRESPFFGFGLRFTDDDLKDVLGSVPLP